VNVTARTLLIADGFTGADDDWMRRWAGSLPDARLLLPVGFGSMDPESWPGAIGRAGAERPGRVALVARGRACHAAAVVAARQGAGRCGPVAGAMFVAPAPAPRDVGGCLAFLAMPSVVVISCGAQAPGAADMRDFARAIGGASVDGGEIGDAGAGAGLGDWTHGRSVLFWLTETIDEGDAALLASCGLSAGAP